MLANYKVGKARLHSRIEEAMLRLGRRAMSLSSLSAAHDDCLSLPTHLKPSERSTTVAMPFCELMFIHRSQDPPNPTLA